MNAKKFSDAMSELDTKYIDEALSYKKKARKPVWVKWGAIAACFCLCALLGVGVWQSGIFSSTVSETPHETAAVPPYLTLNGTTYMISSHLSMSETLPDGFSYAGKTNVVGGGDNLSYYTNADIPEWVYVLQEVRTTGKVDGTGTMIPAEPHDAYVRYVILPLRGKDLLCYNGKQYVSMWTVSLELEDEDLYNAVSEKYGTRIEGTVPNGFSLIGTADFSGYDTIPDGALSMNTEPSEVYWSEAEPEIALVATKWHTAPNNTLHHGFDVYIRWEYRNEK